MLGKTIRMMRISKGFKQGEFSDRTGIPVSILSRIENDRKLIGMPHLLKISEALKVPHQLLMLMSLDPEKIPPDKRKELNSIKNIISDSLIDS